MGVWLSVMLESLLYSYTICCFNILNCFSFIFCFHLNVSFLNVVVCICHFYLICFLKCVYIVFIEF